MRFVAKYLLDRLRFHLSSLVCRSIVSQCRCKGQKVEKVKKGLFLGIYVCKKAQKRILPKI